MKENWGYRGMPPIYIDVLHREVTYQSEAFQTETIYIKGYHPHLGKPHQGWQGAETIVQREVIKPNGEFVIHPDLPRNIDGHIVRIKK